jgi:hypothetical protein
MNTKITELVLCNGLPTDEHELMSFFSGLAANQSIQTLKFEYIQLNDNVIDFLTPFLADNQVFQCLKVVINGCNTDIKTTQLRLASFLLMFNYLREFSLDYIGPTVHLDMIIIQALTVHTELMKLHLCYITISRRG